MPYFLSIHKIIIWEKSKKKKWDQLKYLITMKKSTMFQEYHVVLF